MLPIGGYFELELSKYEELHSNAIALNSGRFCFEYILKIRKYTKIYIPYYICESVIEPLLRLGITYEFYHIDINYHITDYIPLKDNEALLYVNYWGLQSQYCLDLSKQYGNKLILDYTQAFYAKPIAGIDTFYSCRKFFGVPDGGYVYSNVNADFEVEQDCSHLRMNSLIKRIDLSPEDGYDDFRNVSESFQNYSIRLMSKFTKRMMNSIDYNAVAEKRRANYNYLKSRLGGTPLLDNDVPMIFPYLMENGQELRKDLIKNKVFVAQYWPNVKKWLNSESVETYLANNILPLPIDQRYGTQEMQYIIEKIQSWKIVEFI